MTQEACLARHHSGACSAPALTHYPSSSHLTLNLDPTTPRVRQQIDSYPGVLGRNHALQMSPDPCLRRRSDDRRACQSSQTTSSSTGDVYQKSRQEHLHFELCPLNLRCHRFQYVAFLAYIKLLSAVFVSLASRIVTTYPKRFATQALACLHFWPISSAAPPFIYSSKLQFSSDHLFSPDT